VTDSELLAERGGVLIVMSSLGQGGGDRVGMLLANGFARAGIRTRIALMRDAAEIPSLLSGDVSVVSAGPQLGWRISSPPLGHQHLERLRGVRFIRQQIDSFRPAVVLGASDNLGLQLALARRRQDSSTVFALKLTNRLFRPNVGAIRQFIRRKLFRYIFDRLDLVLTLTDADRSDALRHYPGTEALFRTVSNPYVTDEMLVDRKSRETGPPRLLAAGRMVRQKRFDVLLCAFALTSASDARLTILGDGPLLPMLTRLAQQLGIAERVDMRGYVDLGPRLQQADVFVLSSDYEGLPAVVIEALATNVPVVTTDSFHVARELLGQVKSCAVVPIGDPQALAQAIDRCLKAARDEDLRPIASPYGIDAAVDAHIAALARAVEAQNRTETPV
jgi:glycosyltransferase involved in cell wall biosynthesis